DQQAGALAALINGERLGNRLEVADLQAGLLQGADQPEADRVETTAKAGGGEKQRMHGVSFGGVTPPEWAAREPACRKPEARAIGFPIRALGRSAEQGQGVEGDLTLLVG